ncbi:MAG: hypothetical protein A2020_04845 [Lentisphaerae bacterium GWF2_45_14]|nr:MAG: hypothetical protein A2020_04845 [Lentisphaerae bacterium GWF2_45_14]
MYISNFQERRKYNGIWVLCELREGQIVSVSLELLGAAAELAAKRPQAVTAIVLCDKFNDGILQALWACGADRVIAVEDSSLKYFNDEDQAAVLKRLIEKYSPEILLAGATAVGRSLIPRVAVMCHCGLTADCTRLDIENETGALLQTRPAFGGNLMATIRSDSFLPQIATVRPGVMNAVEPQTGRVGILIKEKMLLSEHMGLKKVIGELRSEGLSNYFGSASFIVAGGRGMKGPEGFKLLERFASKIGGVLGATRAAVDAGWAPYGIQIGQTGKTVQPRIYLACGISGQVQHLVGMQSSDMIIAINHDREAPIMSIADIAIVGDVFSVISSLLDALTPVA